MIGGDDKHRIFKPGVLASAFDKVANCPVGVFHAAFTVGVGGNINAAIGVGEWTVI